jgi:hypothetical protein
LQCNDNKENPIVSKSEVPQKSLKQDHVPSPTENLRFSQRMETPFSSLSLWSPKPKDNFTAKQSQSI